MPCPLDEQDRSQPLYADSAYTGQQEILNTFEVEDQICEKEVRNKPLTDEQQESNRKKLKTRARVEQVFGFMENNMGRIFNEKIGIQRAETMIGLMNSTYNMFKKLQLQKISAS